MLVGETCKSRRGRVADVPLRMYPGVGTLYHYTTFALFLFCLFCFVFFGASPLILRSRLTVMAKEHAEDPGVVIPDEEQEYRVVIGRSLLLDRGGDADDDGDDGEEAELSLTEYTPGNREAAHPKAAGKKTITRHSSSSSSANEVCASFRYEFQPASVDKTMPGLVTMDESNGLQVLMGNSSGAAGGILFKGKTIENKDTDCLLIFDGTSFRLEKCPFSCTQLRHVRAPPARRHVKPFADTGSTLDPSASTTAATITTEAVTVVSTTTTAADALQTATGAGKAGRGGRGGRTIAAPRAKPTQAKATKAKAATSTIRKLRRQANAASK